MTDHPCHTPSTGPYPSMAADYGAQTLMGMAGTLAGRAEQALAHSSRDTALPWLVLHLARAVIATTYAQLATAAAIRERTETLAATSLWNLSAETGAPACR